MLLVIAILTISNTLAIGYIVHKLLKIKKGVKEDAHDLIIALRDLNVQVSHFMDKIIRRIENVK